MKNLFKVLIMAVLLTNFCSAADNSNVTIEIMFGKYDNNQWQGIFANPTVENINFESCSESPIYSNKYTSKGFEHIKNSGLKETSSYFYKIAYGDITINGPFGDDKRKECKLKYYENGKEKGTDDTYFILKPNLKVSFDSIVDGIQDRFSCIINQSIATSYNRFTTGSDRNTKLQGNYKNQEINCDGGNSDFYYKLEPGHLGNNGRIMIYLKKAADDKKQSSKFINITASGGNLSPININSVTANMSCNYENKYSISTSNVSNSSMNIVVTGPFSDGADYCQINNYFSPFAINHLNINLSHSGTSRECIINDYFGIRDISYPYSTSGTCSNGFFRYEIKHSSTPSITISPY